MGKGKGAPEYFVAVVKPGRIMFEVAGVDINIAFSATIILIIFGVIAWYIPAKRAAQIKPIVALRDE